MHSSLWRSLVGWLGWAYYLTLLICYNCLLLLFYNILNKTLLCLRKFSMNGIQRKWLLLKTIWMLFWHRWCMISDRLLTEDFVVDLHEFELFFNFLSKTKIYIIRFLIILKCCNALNHCHSYYNNIKILISYMNWLNDI